MASIRERNGSYQITVSTGRDIYGKKLRETATFTPDPSLTPKKREKAVKDFAEEFERKVRNGKVLDGRKTTLKEYSDRWFGEYAPQELQPGTIEKYQAEMEKVLPELGHLKLDELKPSTLKSFFIAMTKDGARKDGKTGGYSKRTIAKTRNVLSSILRTATEDELIDHNPLDKVRVRAEDTAETLKFFTPDQAATFLEYIEKPYTVKSKGHKRIDDTGKEYTVGDYERTLEIPEQLRVLFNLAIYGGLRKGELLALEWSDIDFDAEDHRKRRRNIFHYLQSACICNDSVRSLLCRRGSDSGNYLCTHALPCQCGKDGRQETSCHPCPSEVGMRGARRNLDRTRSARRTGTEGTGCSRRRNLSRRTQSALSEKSSRL